MINKVFIIHSIVFLFNITPANSQFTVDLGSDTTYCVAVMSPEVMYLAPDLSVSNAVDPVDYRWECEYVLSENTTFIASDFLDDTTSKSPVIKDHITWPDWLTFMVTAEDQMGHMAIDSIHVRFSVFVYSLGFFQLYIDQGDSIQIGGEFIGGGIEPLTYLWTPSTWLNDSTLYAPWAKPDSSISYYQVAIDSIGCISVPNKGFHVVVEPTQIKEIYSEDKPFIQKGSILEFNDISTVPEIMVYSAKGKLIAHFNPMYKRIDLSEHTQCTGLNIATFSIQGNYYSIKFLK